MKDMDEQDRQLQEMKKSGALMPPDPAAFAQVTERLAKIHKGFSVEIERSRRRLKWLKVAMFVGLAILVITLILKVLSRL
jgi:hypothetical protein